VGKVVTPWTRKAPGLRNGTRTAISKGEPRRLVVCGTTVISQRGPGFAGQAEIDQPDLTAL